MQTILGASGQIGRELAIFLNRDFTDDLRLVSRNPSKVNKSDRLHHADLLDAGETRRAVEGSEIVYLTAGLPMDTTRWVEQWPVIMANVIDACAAQGAKLVFFDNTYMYPQTAEPQTEETAFRPSGPKGRVRAAIAEALLAAIDKQRLTAMICRAPEFYGPGNTQSITNSAIIEPRGQVRLDILDTFNGVLDLPRSGDDTRSAGQKTLDGGAAEALRAAADEHALAGELGGIRLDGHSVTSSVSMAPLTSVKR